MIFDFVVIWHQISQEDKVLMLSDIHPDLEISLLPDYYLEIDGYDYASRPQRVQKVLTIFETD